MDEEDSGGSVVKSPIRRLGSTRKLLIFNNIRVQLGEQLRCLDARLESQLSLVSELQDYFRRRAEVELDYSKNLDKLARSLQLRHKEQRQNYSCWQQLISQTKNLSKDHAALSEVYSTHMVGRFSQVMEDVQRIYRRCREIGYESHEEILRVLHELHTTMKTYHSYQAECKQAETKLRLAEAQRLKLEQTLPRDKLDRSKKYRLIEKELQKRKNKYNDAKLKAFKARNEYVLCLEASNTTIHKYFVEDLSDLIDCMDFGFHNCISRALLMHVSAEEGRQQSAQTGLDQMNVCVSNLDSGFDKQRFLESNHTAFMIPKKFEFQGQKDEDGELELQKSLRDELEARLCQLQNRVTSLRTESEEVWKTLETAETTLLDMLDARDYDCKAYFGEGAQPSNRPPETLSLKLRADRHETEEFYLTKFREFLLGTSRIARLDAKQEHLRQMLQQGGGESPTSLRGVNASSGKPPPRRKRIGRLQMSGQPKLFGGSLVEYLETTGQEIPLIVKSCIRVINLYGLHHQGIFRVSGSQVEINNFRESFERGEDPLADVTDASDINSVAGVLKLYLRELREPLFPIIYFEHFMELAQLESKHEFVVKMKDLVQSLPRSVVVVMRYLFAFLNHLSEFSDENMMDPYNLAICFGPTLVPVPEDKDQVQYQNQVNELIKNIILFYEEIFPMDGGVMYEKYISKEPDENDVGDSPSDHIQEDMDSEVYPSEDESENMEATAQFDFLARSDRELSFKKGDNIILFTQVSNDWWRGSVNGQEGLIPDKYIMLKMKDEDRDKPDGGLRSSSSEESVRRRASSSNDSVLSGSGAATGATGRGPSRPHKRYWRPPCPEGECGETEEREERSGAAEEDTLSVFLDSLPAGDDASDSASASVSCDDEASGAEADQEEKPEEGGVVNFSQSREMWQKRAAEASLKPQSQSGTAPTKSFRSNQEFWEMRQKHTPDLVMDLPEPGAAGGGKKSLSLSSLSSSGSSGEEEIPVTGPESPDMTTAAERFAKQNQCTLKKNTKAAQSASMDAQTQTVLKKPGVVVPPSKQDSAPLVALKPQVKAKPQILRKPVLPPPNPQSQPSPEMLRKEQTH